MGRSQGELVGFRDGQQLGHTKGIEFGMELGFIQGFLNVIEKQIQEEQQSSERIQRSLIALHKALDDFPSPDVLFDHSTMIFSNSTGGEDSEGPVTKLDVLNKMQRVRARFKLLTVQLGMGTISLKQILANGASSDRNQEIPSREW
jgi:helix-turn-helix protein